MKNTGRSYRYGSFGCNATIERNAAPSNISVTSFQQPSGNMDDSGFFSIQVSTAVLYCC